MSTWNIANITEEQKTLYEKLSSELSEKLSCEQTNKLLSEQTRTLLSELKNSPLSVFLLVRRNLTTADEVCRFIFPNLAELHDPFLMKDMRQAVERLDKAIKQNEKILIYGDYDVDGTTAVSLVYKFLLPRYQEDKIDFYIPDRYTEGYGVSFKGIDYAKANDCTLIIALDCGIKSVDKVEYAKSKGIDFIICDHHTPDEQLPNAVAVLDPHRDDDTYPYRELSGCGVGFKLMQAYAATHDIPFSELHQLLPLLAMSIASDIVPITGENRVLAHYGLEEINQSPSVGIQSIMQIAGIQAGQITISDLVYKIGPRVNACGRMKSGKDAVKLLITDDEDVAKEMAGTINQYNSERQATDKNIYEEALRKLDEDPNNAQKCSTVVCGHKWHKGVVGIVASRLIEKHYRPTIVLTDDGEGIVSGSARSVSDFDIYSAIDSCRGLLTNFGGHMFAAGLSMKSENLDDFKQRFEAYVSEHITDKQKELEIDVDAVISFAEITPQFVKILRSLEPYGPGNPRPVFVTRNLVNYKNTKRVGKKGEHLKLDVTDGNVHYEGIGFGLGEFAYDIQNGTAVDVCYELEENVWNGRYSIQMQVQDIKLSQNNN